MAQRRMLSRMLLRTCWDGGLGVQVKEASTEMQLGPDVEHNRSGIKAGKRTLNPGGSCYRVLVVLACFLYLT